MKERLIRSEDWATLNTFRMENEIIYPSVEFPSEGNLLKCGVRSQFAKITMPEVESKCPSPHQLGVSLFIPNASEQDHGEKDDPFLGPQFDNTNPRFEQAVDERKTLVRFEADQPAPSIGESLYWIRLVAWPEP